MSTERRTAPRVIEQEPEFFELLILHRCARSDAEADEICKKISAFVDGKIEAVKQHAVQQERDKHAKR